MHGSAITKSSSHMKNLEQTIWTEAAILLFTTLSHKNVIFRTPLVIALLTTYASYLRYINSILHTTSINSKQEQNENEQILSTYWYAQPPSQTSPPPPKKNLCSLEINVLIQVAMLTSWQVKCYRMPFFWTLTLRYWLTDCRLQYDVVAFLFVGRNVQKDRYFVHWISGHKCCLETSTRRQSPEQNPQLYRSENLKTRWQNGCVLNALLLGSVNQQSSEKLSVSRSIYMEHMTVFWKHHKVTIIHVKFSYFCVLNLQTH